MIELPDCAERLELARSAAAEIEALASVLKGAVPAGTDGSLVVRGVTVRLKVLAGVVMSAVDDELEPVASLRDRLFGANGGAS